LTYVSNIKRPPLVKYRQKRTKTLSLLESNEYIPVLTLKHRNNMA